jgi:hypothetical protein
LRVRDGSGLLMMVSVPMRGRAELSENPTRGGA